MIDFLVRVSFWVMESGLSTLGNHLWQSTLFAVPVVLLAVLLRGNAARVRYTLWAAASIKFLVPFALLAAIATQVSWHLDVGRSATQLPPVLEVVSDLVAPMERAEIIEFGTVRAAYLPPRVPLAVIYLWLAIFWAAGVLVVGGRWWWRLRALMSTVRASTPAECVDFPVPVRFTTTHLEPGVVGIFRPILLLPVGITERLTPAQMRAVLAHELCHLRRRDNLMAALHMLVETVFWFHPLVWWIGARLIDERERACDQQVLRQGHAPESYGEAILRVCEHYLVSRLPCVSGVSGSDIRKRIQGIMNNALIARLGRAKRLVLVAAAGLAVTAPIAAGVVSWRTTQSTVLTREAVFQDFNLWRAMPRFPPCSGPSADFVARQKQLARTVAQFEADDGPRVLFYAVIANSAADVRRLLAAGARSVSDGGVPDALMHVAARTADVPVLEALLDGGYSVDGMDSIGSARVAAIGKTPLMAAIETGRLQNADWFIRHGADLDVSNVYDITAMEVAMVSCRNQSMVTRLIQAGAVPNARARRVADSRHFELEPVTAQPAGD